MRGIIFLIVAIMVMIGTLQTIGTVSAHPLSGAIFTTLPDGSVVNENHYDAKCDVALNGGSHKSQAHHLPDGVYDIAVTDPSGKTVLGKGEDAVTIANGEGTFGPTSLCDLVEPSPYDTTPNNGGVYKAWLCVSGQLYVSNSCKTDNFKVRLSEPLPEPTPTLMPTPTATSIVQPPETTSTPTPTSVPVTPSIGPIPPEPTTTPTATSTAQPPEEPIPEPKMPVAFPDSGGEPPTNDATRNIALAGTGIAALVLSAVAGHLVLLRRR